jgi:hypothetical protein
VDIKFIFPFEKPGGNPIGSKGCIIKISINRGIVGRQHGHIVVRSKPLIVLLFMAALAGNISGKFVFGWGFGGAGLAAFKNDDKGCSQ